MEVDEFYKQIGELKFTLKPHMISMVEWYRIIIDKLVLLYKSTDSYKCIIWNQKWKRIKYHDVYTKQVIILDCRRFFYEQFIGDLTEREGVTQICDKDRLCVQPRHLTKNAIRGVAHKPKQPNKMEGIAQEELPIPITPDILELYEHHHPFYRVDTIMLLKKYCEHSIPNDTVDDVAIPSNEQLNEDGLNTNIDITEKKRSFDDISIQDNPFGQIHKIPRIRSIGESDSDTDSISFILGSDAEI